MSAALTSAMVSELTGDATIVAAVATYRSTPAVFATDPAPPDASYPLIIVSGPVAASIEDTFTDDLRSVVRDVRCYVDTSGEQGGGTLVALEDMAERVKVLFHRNRFAVTGFRTDDVSAGPAITAPSTPPIAGQVVPVTISLEKI